MKTEITTERNLFYRQKQAEIRQELESTPLAKLMFQLAAEKGASAWLTALPLKEYGYLMNKQQFSDAIALRYNLNLEDKNKIRNVKNHTYCSTRVQRKKMDSKYEKPLSEVSYNLIPAPVME